MANKDNSASTPRPRRGGMGGPGGGPMAAFGKKEKPKDFKGTLGKLIRYLGKYRIGIVVVMIFAICSTVFAILGPKILGNATTKLFEGIMGELTGSGPGVDFTAIGGILLWLMVLYGISAGFSFVQGWMITGIANKVTYKIRSEIQEKIHRLPLSYFDKVSTGDVLSRMTTDVDVISQTLNQSVSQVIISFTTLVGILIMMFTISWHMTLVALLTLPVSFGFIAMIVKASQKHFSKQQEYLGKVSGQVEENYGSHVVVRAFNGEERALEEFKRDNNILYTSAWKANFLSGMMMPIMGFIGNIGYVAICILGGYFAAQGSITVGDIQAFVQYTRQFTQPIAQVSQSATIIQQTVAAAERVFEFLEEKEEPQDEENALNLCDKDEAPGENCVALTGAVEFKNVHFGYSQEKCIINDFSAVVKPGQKVAIVGPTGAGKTTIVKLLMRFYDISSGQILLDEHDIRSFKRKELREAFGMVLQDTWLTNASIDDNIRYGRLDATKEEVRSAAKAAQVDHFVSTLPKGYHMVINEESNNISQGQKQLLTIARAILADPKILILDEATSSVDTRTEMLIQKAMDNLMQGRTSFIIAHRLSTIRNADLILVMNLGDIVEMGNHEELMKKAGFYANLYNAQFS
jgi:ATP-binding cassette, subfamily B, multidrug efflux pump